MNKTLATLILIFIILFLTHQSTVSKITTYEQYLNSYLSTDLYEETYDCEKLEYSVFKKEYIIYKNLKIREGITRCFKEQTSGFKKITINSRGGDVNEALKLSKYINESGKSLFIPNYCLSSCVLLAASSPGVAITPTTVFGFHNTYINKENYIYSVLEELLFFNYNVKMKDRVFNDILTKFLQNDEYLDKINIKDYKYNGLDVIVNRDVYYKERNKPTLIGSKKIIKYGFADVIL